MSIPRQAGALPDSGAGRVASRVLGYALLAGIILAWGGNWPAMKIALGHLPALWFSALRFAGGALCLLGPLAVTGRLALPDRADLPLLATGGLLQMLAFTSFAAFALKSLPAGHSVVLAYSTPIWVAPGAVLLLKEPVRPLGALGVALGLCGIAILVSPWDAAWSNAAVEANGFLLLAAFSWAGFILHLRRHAPVTPALVLAFWQMILAATLLAVLARCMEGPLPGIDGSAAAAMLYVGPVGTAFCFWGMLLLGRRFSPVALSVGLLGVPVSGLAISAALLGELPSSALVTGTAMILCGIGVVISAEAEQRRGPALKPPARAASRPEWPRSPPRPVPSASRRRP